MEHCKVPQDKSDNKVALMSTDVLDLGSQTFLHLYLTENLWSTLPNQEGKHKPSQYYQLQEVIRQAKVIISQGVLPSRRGYWARDGVLSGQIVPPS